MAVLTVGNLEDDLVRRLRIRAAEHGHSAEAEHREILRRALLPGTEALAEHQRIADRLAEFRRRTTGRASPSVLALLYESRANRTSGLTGRHENR